MNSHLIISFPARGNLALLDVDPIGEKIWLIGHGVDQSRYFGASEATIFSKRGSPRSESQ